MLLDISHAIIDFVVLVTRLTTEELSDEQRIVLIDQFIHPQGLDSAFQFDLHDLLMIPITILIIIFWRAWSRANRWPYRRFILTRMLSHYESATFFSWQAPTAMVILLALL
jgi:hypothetical protein